MKSVCAAYLGRAENSAERRRLLAAGRRFRRGPNTLARIGALTMTRARCMAAARSRELRAQAVAS